jgi:hypothetical protein
MTTTEPDTEAEEGYDGPSEDFSQYLPNDVQVREGTGLPSGSGMEARNRARRSTEAWREAKEALDELAKARDADIKAAAAYDDVTMADVVRDTGLARVTVERIVNDPEYHRPRGRKNKAHEGS